MSRLSKYLLVLISTVFVLACNAITQPFRDAQEAVGTVQSIASEQPLATLEALASAMPMETLQSMATSLPVETLQALPSSLPDVTNMFDPQGEPVEEYKGVPIMPEATAGQEFTANSTYSFRADATVEAAQDFYNNAMVAAGWSSMISMPGDANSAILVFQKDSSIATITISSVDGALVVFIMVV